MNFDPQATITLPVWIVIGVPTVLGGVIAAQWRRMNAMADHWSARLEQMLEDARHERIERESTRLRR